jgi:predicted MPP superfamily phosphohydrolase
MHRFSFFLRVPVILGFAHVYVALRLALAAPPGINRWAVVLAIAAIYAMIASGFAMRRSVGRPAGDLMAWVGFLFLGLFSWLFVLTVLRDVLLSAAYLVNALGGGFVSGQILTGLRSTSAAAVAALAFAAGLIGLWNARRLARVIDVDVHIDKLPIALCGFSIVQITDLHVGPTIKRGYVEGVVAAVNKLKPDLIALTGDMVDGSVDRLIQDTQPLSRLKARHGVYAVTGNHEYYSGADQWVDEFRRLGLRVLMNQHEVLQHDGAELMLAGVTDFGAGRFDSTQASDPAKAMAGAPAGAAVRILLAHQPRSAPAAASAGFDLQLSGHTHGGQFWPWRYMVPLQQPFVAGLHRLGDLQVYVSRGTGYWGPPLRLGAQSEITRIHLRDGSAP